MRRRWHDRLRHGALSWAPSLLIGGLVLAGAVWIFAGGAAENLIDWLVRDGAGEGMRSDPPSLPP